MSSWDTLWGTVIVPHGVDLTGVNDVLRQAGVTVGSSTGRADVVHLVPYDDGTAVIVDPDAPPICWLGSPINPHWLLTALRTAADMQTARRGIREARTLLDICRAMGSQPDEQSLYRFLVRKSRELTNADAGTLYVVEQQGNERVLRFAMAQTGPHDEEKFTGGVLPLSRDSFAGSVALDGTPLRIDDAYAVSDDRRHFDATFDKATGYRTKSVLCVPIHNHLDDVVGVLQLINRKPTFDVPLSRDVLSEEILLPFDRHDEELLTALAAQAGVALENSRLIGERRPI